MHQRSIEGTTKNCWVSCAKHPCKLYGIMFRSFKYVLSQWNFVQRLEFQRPKCIRLLIHIHNQDKDPANVKNSSMRVLTFWKLVYLIRYTNFHEVQYNIYEVQYNICGTYKKKEFGKNVICSCSCESRSQLKVAVASCKENCLV